MAYIFAPTLILAEKTMELKASCPFSGMFIINDSDTAKATSESGFTYKLYSGGLVKFIGEKMNR